MIPGYDENDIETEVMAAARDSKPLIPVAEHVAAEVETMSRDALARELLSMAHQEQHERPCNGYGCLTCLYVATLRRAASLIVPSSAEGTEP